MKLAELILNLVIAIANQTFRFDNQNLSQKLASRKIADYVHIPFGDTSLNIVIPAQAGIFIYWLGEVG